MFDTMIWMKIAVVGTGYVGLVSGVCFAEMGNDVVCIDIDEAKIKTLSAGKTPIYEPKLQDLMVTNTKAGRLTFTTSLPEGIKEAEVIFLALPTPPAEDGSADLQYVLAVADEIGEHLDHFAVIVNKSTVPVGTSDKVMDAISAKNDGDFDVVSNPEFLREGLAVDDFLNPDRIVVGTSNDKSKAKMAELYKPLTDKGAKLFIMDTRSSELTKYAANAFLATKISFMNEIANLCELLDANVDNVKQGVGSDTRIGEKFLNAGIGYGGSCFPKDVQALHRTALENDYNFSILDAVTEVNAYQKRRIVNKIKHHFDDKLRGKKIAIWGLAFKPETDDIREAPALEIISGLIKEGAEVHAYDPEAMDNVKKFYEFADEVKFHDSMDATIAGADALVIATEWSEFKNADLEKVKQALSSPVIFDGRNLFDTDSVKSMGFDYHSIGRGKANV